MKEYVADHKLIIIALVAIVGFIVFAVLHHPDSPQATDSYAVVDTAKPMTKGNKDAKVSLIQYSDLICPSCSYLSTQIMPTIEKEFIDTGKVKFEFRPMAFIADGSTQAGMGAFCAVEQNKFWDYHDAVYSVVADKTLRQNLDPKTQVILDAASVEQIAASVGVDTVKFNDCIDTKTHLSDITSATTTAQRHGVSGTPYLLINGQHYQGDITLASIEAYIKALL